MDLDNRKMMILKSIIQTYLETGEPVGSRTISKASGLNVSSATIRNEMADLEELGLIEQPHTSAGRIPTDKGYRLYVDELMEEKERKALGVQNILMNRIDRVESALQQMAKMLAANTNYATMISGPRYTDTALKMIQLSRLDSKHVVAVIVVDGNVLRNKLIDVETSISDADLLKLNILLNSALQGKSLDDISLNLVRRLQKEAGDYSAVIGSVLEAVADAISESASEKPEVFTSGTTNIFNYPELSDGSTAREILTTFEEKNELADFLVTRQNDQNGIRVYIGDETSMNGMKDCSVVTANYELDKGVRGVIGIVGPKRMDYEHVFSTLHTLMTELDDLYHKNDREG